jgi:Ulp1 family protease
MSKIPEDKRSKVYVFSALFYTKLTESINKRNEELKRSKYNNVKNWTSFINLN